MRRKKPEPEAITSLRTLIALVRDLRATVADIRDQHNRMNPPEVNP